MHFRQWFIQIKRIPILFRLLDIFKIFFIYHFLIFLFWRLKRERPFRFKFINTSINCIHNIFSIQNLSNKMSLFIILIPILFRWILLLLFLLKLFIIILIKFILSFTLLLRGKLFRAFQESISIIFVFLQKKVYFIFLNEFLVY